MIVSMFALDVEIIRYLSHVLILLAVVSACIRDKLYWLLLPSLSYALFVDSQIGSEFGGLDRGISFNDAISDWSTL